MAEFRSLTPDFAVAGQLTTEDFARAAAEGYRAIINNRPDGEAPDQMSDAEAKAAAEAAGLGYRALPFQGMPPPNVVGETADFIEQVRGPVLAYCRTGTRSTTAWALAEALSGAHSPDEIVELAGKAGYDLTRLRLVLERLAPKD